MASRRNARSKGRATQAEPDRLRAALYVRVSTEEQVQGYSLDAQERAARATAELRDWDLVAVYRDEGRSARTEQISKRPAFAQMLEDAEAGQFDLVVVHKLDRFARNLLVTLDTLNRLERSGVGFVSLSEQMDFTTPIGKVILATLAAFAQYYSDNLSHETRKGLAERKRQGMYNGLLPFGTTTNQDGVPILDERPWACNIASREELSPASGLRLAFTLAAEGKSDRLVAQGLNEQGYLTSGNRGQNRFSKDTVRVILTNRFFLGELPDGEGGWLPGKHAAMIDRDLFERVQQRREENRQRPTSTGVRRSPWALSGVAVCGYCGRSMTSSGRSDGKRRIQCQGRAQGLECEAPTFYADAVVDQLANFLDQFGIPSAKRAAFLAKVTHYRKRANRHAAKRQRLEQQASRLRELYLEGELERDEYQSRRDAVQRDLASIPDHEPEEIEAEQAEHLADYLAQMGTAWRDATEEERNRLARELFSEVVVNNRTAVAIVPRPDLRPYFEALTGVMPVDVTHRRKRRDSNPRSQP